MEDDPNDMAQQQNERRRQFLTILLYAYLAFFAYMMFFAPKPRPAPEQTAQVLQEARALEAEGRRADPNVALADRVKKIEKAIQKYEQYYQWHKNTPEGIQARFQEVNLYDYLANLEGRRSGTHRYDQAEALLKEMEKTFFGRTGTVTLEEDGRTRTVTGDLGRIASERLNSLRRARDLRHRDRLTYRILDALVNLTGRDPRFSYAFALALIVIVLKALTFPLQKKQYRYLQDMMRIQPLVEQLQKEMKGRPPEELNRRIFQLYREHHVNPASGCLPMIVLAFVLLPVFWMVRDYEFQFTNGQFLWIGSELSRKVWWLADNLAQFDVPLFVLYLVSMVIYSLLQPKPANPQAAQQQKIMTYLMPVVFGWIMWIGQWSSAFMFYWLVLNLVSMYQSWSLLRQFGHATPAPAGAAPAGKDGAAPVATPLPPMKGVHTPPASNGKKTAGRVSARGRSRQSRKR